MSKTVTEFAKAELSRYLTALGVSADIKLGLLSELGVQMPLDNPTLDDAIVIKVKDKSGFIGGSNERSVLIGVYRLLSEWGIGWVRPGKLGEHIPKNAPTPDLDISEVASRRKRCICIEGAVSLENVLEHRDYPC